MKWLTEDPETLEDGVFVLEEKKGLLGKLLAKKRDDDVDLDMPISKPRATPRSEEELRRIAETKALVEEALQET